MKIQYITDARLLAGIVFAAVIPLLAVVAQAAADDRAAPAQRAIWTDQPVVILPDQPKPLKYFQRMWDSSVYPIGNGRLGCVAYGEPQKETIQFNEDSLWVGNEHNTGAYQPFGEVYVELPHREFTNYRRELDISRAVMTITCKSGGVNYKREYFASHPAQVMVFCFTADRKGALTGKVYLGNQHEVPVTAAGETLTMKGNTSTFAYWKAQAGNPARLLSSRQYASDKIIDLDFEAQARVLCDGGTVKTVDNIVVFENCGV